MTPLVLVMVGTDHHPFDRLVGWADDAARRRSDVRFVVQHGTSGPPSYAEGRAFLSAEEVSTLSRRATAFVCHAGPGLITDAREAGHVPICVPRDPARGEHVDDHQLLFSDRVGRLGVVDRVMTQEELEAALDRVLASSQAGPAPRRFGADDVALGARARLAEELDRLMLPKAGSRVRPPAHQPLDAPAAPVQLGHHPVRGDQPGQHQEREERPGFERKIS